MILESKIDTLVAKSFVAPYILSFAIAQFVLVMQFLWQYIDDISGKGLSIFEILELIFYFSLTLIPRSIPITVLLSAVFVFGNMSEKFELTSMKSAGVSLFRIMRMGMVIAVLTAILSVIASNIIVPKANYVFYKKFDAIRKQKSALFIDEGMFNEDFRNFKIYVGKKDRDGKTVSDILIYDHSPVDNRRINLITAKSGVMTTSEDGKLFIMKLYDGEQYRDIAEKTNTVNNSKRYPFSRTKFKEWEKRFDMSEFELNESDILSSRRSFDLMNTPQLLYSIDSINTQLDKLSRDNMYDFNEILGIKKYAKEGELHGTAKVSADKYIPKNSTVDQNTTNKKEANAEKKSKPNAKAISKKRSTKSAEKRIIKSFQDSTIDIAAAATFYETIIPDEQTKILKSALTKANHVSNPLKTTRSGIKSNISKRSWFLLKLNQKYSWAFICFLFLFIGAPLGSIIKKGGYGFPLLISISFFMLFTVLMIMGERLMRSDTLGGPLAAWLPNIVLLPFAILFTVKAINDSSFNFSRIQGIFKKEEISE